MQGHNYQVDKEPILNIPIKNIKNPKPYVCLCLVDKILTAKQQNQDATAFETQIDKLVYQLYDLTTDEIKIIEGKK